MTAFSLAEQDDEALASGDACVKKVPVEHGIMLRRDRNDHDGIFRSLRFMDRGRIGEGDLIQFAESVDVTSRPSKSIADLTCVYVHSPVTNPTSPL